MEDGPTRSGDPYWSTQPAMSQRKRRRLNRSKKNKLNRMVKHCCSYWKKVRYNDKFLMAVQQRRLDVKNARRAQNGLPPLDSYAQV